MLTQNAIQIASAETLGDLNEIKRMFRAYVAWLDIDLTYQGFEEELAGLPGKYSEPTGALFLAKNNEGISLGCVGLRPMSEDGVCEMKRLYVLPDGRAMGVGAALIETVVTAARSAGYQRMLLDTLPTMTSAIKLYTKAGFKEISAYYDTPIKETVFFEKVL
ncbi:MAG: GNAT family N-acetyltransferase [Roseibium sp.]